MNKILATACFLIFSVVSLYSQVIEYETLSITTVFYDEANPSGKHYNVPIKEAYAALYVDKESEANTCFEVRFLPDDPKVDRPFVLVQCGVRSVNLGSLTLFLHEFEDENEGIKMDTYILAKPLRVTWD